MAYLRIYAGKTMTAQHALTSGRISIGRAEDNDIVLDGAEVSKHHAHLEKQGTTFVLVDDDSANGVMINGKRIQRQALNYRDEIQIFNHTLIFMPLAKLPGEAKGGQGMADGQMAQDSTMVVDASVIGDLIDKRKRENVAHLVTRDAAGEPIRHILDKDTFTIGRAVDCDMRAGGWLSPRVAATLQRRADAHYVVPARRGRVRLNGQWISEPTALKDDDKLKIRGLAATFRFRPLA